MDALVRYVSGFPLDIATINVDGYGSAFFKTYVASSMITCCETLFPIALGTVKRIPRSYKITRRHGMLRWKDSRSAYSLKLLLINAIVLQLFSHLTLDEAMMLVVSIQLEAYQSSHNRR